MLDIEGAKLISAAYIFGMAGVGFVTLPFLAVVTRAIYKGNNASHNTKSLDIVSVFGWALIIHVLASLSFMGIILILDGLSVDVPNYYTTKIFPIFWAETKAEVFTLAGVGASGTESDVAYTTLNFFQTMVKLLLTFLPFVVILLGCIYGFVMASKDSYKESYLTVIVYMIISFILVSLLYLFWAKISTYALFVPTDDLIKYIATIWSSLLT